MIIWDYVKGLNEQGDSYTYIKFPTTNINTTSGQYKTVPTIYTTGSANDPYVQTATTNKIDFGKILTSHDYIELTANSNETLDFYLKKAEKNPISFNIYNTIKTEKINGTDIPTTPLKITLSNNQIDFVGDVKINGSKIQLNSNGSIQVDGGVTTGSGITINNDNIKLTSDGAIIAKNKCEAVYFNATSDMRAKTNLRSLTLNACDYIKQIPIYSFQYKNNTKPSIGVLAQDLTCKPIDESVNNFNFVDNIEATGIDNDYMSVKESKFVYLCMKAIQELTDENRILMCKINDLENKINQLQK